MDMKPGSRFKSAVCQTEVAVVRPPKSAAILECGGVSMLAMGAPAGDGNPAADHAAGSLIGKRYIDAQSGLEVLCTKGGAGSLSVDGRPMGIKESKALPSSD